MDGHMVSLMRLLTTLCTHVPLLPEAVVTGEREDVDVARDPEAGEDQAEAAHDHQVDREAAVEGGDPGTGQDDRHSASVPPGVLDHDGGLVTDRHSDILPRL